MKNENIYLILFILCIVLAFAIFFIRPFHNIPFLYSLSDFLWFLAALFAFNYFFNNLSIAIKNLMASSLLIILVLDEVSQLFISYNTFYQPTFDLGDVIAYIFAYIFYLILHLIIENVFHTI